MLTTGFELSYLTLECIIVKCQCESTAPLPYKKHMKFKQGMDDDEEDTPDEPLHSLIGNSTPILEVKFQIRTANMIMLWTGCMNEYV